MVRFPIPGERTEIHPTPPTSDQRTPAGDRDTSNCQTEAQNFSDQVDVKIDWQEGFRGHKEFSPFQVSQVPHDCPEYALLR